MANNRLWAVCKLDHQATVVAKYYPYNWYHVNCETEWFEKHTHEEEAESGSDPSCGTHIVFVQEVEDPRVKEYDFREQGNPKIYLN